MRTLFIAAVTLVAAACAHAASPYAGVNLATPGEVTLDINGRSVANDNTPRAVKLYAGLQFTPGWAGEVGYGAFGSWHVADPAPGSGYEVRLGAKVVYLAARAAQPLGESFSLFGKLGLALNRLEQRDSLGHSERETYVRPMGGVGLAWQLSGPLSATVEWAHYGSRHRDGSHFDQQKLEVGLGFKF